MKTLDPQDTHPWYRQFWPWFLILLPGTAVIAGITTVIIATRDSDSLVVDDYYKKGLAINRDLDRDRQARQLGLTAKVEYLGDQSMLRIALAGRTADQLTHLRLRLSHPTLAEKDLALTPTRLGARVFEVAIPPMLPANWHLSIMPPDVSWRLSGRMQLPTQTRIELP